MIAPQEPRGSPARPAGFSYGKTTPCQPSFRDRPTVENQPSAGARGNEPEQKLSVRNERSDSLLLRVIIAGICPRASDLGEPARSGTGGPDTGPATPQVNTRRALGRPINRSEAEVDSRALAKRARFPKPSCLDKLSFFLSLCLCSWSEPVQRLSNGFLFPYSDPTIAPRSADRGESRVRERARACLDAPRV